MTADIKKIGNAVLKIQYMLTTLTIFGLSGYGNNADFPGKSFGPNPSY
jgi:hypothetical protein